MNTRFFWKIGQLPDNAASIVWVRDDQGPYWSRLPDGASQAEIEKGFAQSYDFGKRREPITCKATIMKDGKKTVQWQFTIHPPVKNISDIYVQYEASEPFKGGAPKVLRVFAKVPRAKIEAYRRVRNDQTSSDTDIARNLSEGPALSSFPQPHWLGPINYPNALPAELHEPEPAFEENGMTFWTLKD
jgi:hypothetical protein